MTMSEDTKFVGPPQKQLRTATSKTYSKKSILKKLDVRLNFYGNGHGQSTSLLGLKLLKELYWFCAFTLSIVIVKFELK